MRHRAAVPVLPLLLGSCAWQHYQSSFSDAAIEARQFDALFITFLVVCAVMYVLVIAFLILSLVRRNRAGAANVAEDGHHHRSNRLIRGTLHRRSSRQ